jgi:hypothetical protein
MRSDWEWPRWWRVKGIIAVDRCIVADVNTGMNRARQGELFFKGE